MSDTQTPTQRPGYKPGGTTGRGFRPGQSGNPAGQVRRTKDGRTVAQLARDLTEDALKVLREIAKNKKEPAGVRIQAATAIVSRGWGDAPKVQANLDLHTTPASQLTTAQIAQLLGVTAPVQTIEAEALSPQPQALARPAAALHAVPTNPPTKKEA